MQVSCRAKACDIKSKASDTTTKWRDIRKLARTRLDGLRKCPCSVHSEPHKWAANFINHHTKFVHVVTLHRKSAEEVLGVFKTYCLTFGYPRKLITDNGKEFKNKEMNQFCDNNGIKLSHGSSRTPTTQGLVERSNRTWKESTRSLFMSTDKKVDHWCERTLESSYTMNISYHSTIKTSPYEAVFGFKAHREKATPLPEACEQYDTETETDQEKTPPAAQTSSESGTKHHETDHERSSERLKKRRKIQESQEKYNQKMVDSSKERRQKFKINDLVSIKIDKVDKSTLHPNLLMAKLLVLIAIATMYRLSLHLVGLKEPLPQIDLIIAQQQM